MSTIAGIAALRLRVSPKTVWIMVRAVDADGVVGWGEATLNGREDDVVAATQRIGRSLVGAPLAPGTMRVAADDTLPAWAAASGIDAALCDIAARRAGVPVATLLGGGKRDRIAVYANINRRTTDREPAGFAATARDAQAQGHARFKLAPFDGLSPALCGTPEGRRLTDAGLARIAAVRDAVGAAEVMVDCHWRFAAAAVPDLIDALAALGVSWLECPIPEDTDAPATLARLRGAANRRGMRLAGCETQTTDAAFGTFLDAGAYDVVMPDVKYVGTLDAMLRIAARAARAGAACAPHNPSGPISHAASLHVSAAMADFLMLEMQFDETPHFDALVAGALPRAIGGAIAAPSGAGLSVAIDPDALARVSGARGQNMPP
jgi:galactonate dehydratase